MKSPYRLSDVRRTLRAKAARLRRYPNVLHLAIGEKKRRGRGQGYLAIRVFVSAKPKSLPKSQRLPMRVRGVNPDGSAALYWIPLDVERLPGKFRALSVRGGDGIRRILRGVAGLVYVSRSNRNFLLTNSHVIARPNEVAFNEPVNKVGVTEPIGQVHRMIAIRSGIPNKMDAAIVWLYQDVAADFLALRHEARQVTDVEALSPLKDFDYFFIDRLGNRKHFGSPNEVSDPVTVEVGGLDLLFQGFWTLKLKAGSPAVSGDSGSLLVRQVGSGLVAVGLVFAGAGDVVAVFALSSVFATLRRASASVLAESEMVEINFS